MTTGNFLFLSSMIPVSLAGQSCNTKNAELQKPNIIVILTDQLAENMLSCDGNAGLSTPAMDRIVSEGVRFERTYAGNPVSIPSRFSLMTGTLPSVIGMETNEELKNNVPDELRLGAMGFRLKEAGYHTAYFGKKHLTGADSEHGLENPHAYGFDFFPTVKDPEGREPTVQACLEYLSRDHALPFFMYINLINPHDICYKPLNEELIYLGEEPLPGRHSAMRVINEVMPDSITPEFIDKTPPLPFNYARPEGHDNSFRNNAGYLKWASDHYTDDDWRVYRYLYDRLIEVVDDQIGRIMDALKAAGLDENTLVVFTSDHGEMNGVHQMTTKGVLYEESARVPMVVRWKGVLPGGKVVKDRLVSNGLDLLPTLCDFAGAPVENPVGRSVRPLLCGDCTDWRESLVIENEGSRMVIFGNWKYMVAAPGWTGGRKGGQREVLVDLDLDPGELGNLANDPGSAKKLAEGRRLLREWYAVHGLQLDPKYIVN